MSMVCSIQERLLRLVKTTSESTRARGSTVVAGDPFDIRGQSGCVREPSGPPGVAAARHSRG